MPASKIPSDHERKPSTIHRARHPDKNPKRCPGKIQTRLDHRQRHVRVGRGIFFSLGLRQSEAAGHCGDASGIK